MTDVFIYPGQLRASADAMIIRTILGSCVGVVLWENTAKVGGMCHYLLPDAPSKESQSGRYGVFAIETLIEEMLRLGAQRNRLQARVYGGGAVVSALTGMMAGIGDRNIACALDTLKKFGIPVTEQKTGGVMGCRVALDTVTGEVLHTVQGADATISRAGVEVQKPADFARVLIVDDSSTFRSILKGVFDRSKKVTVVGTAIDPFDARDKILQLKPDVITLDIEMPRMNGIVFLEKLMTHFPMPVVVVSSLAAQGPAAERALELGAIEFVHKPSQFDPMVLTDLGEQLIPKVIGAAGATVKKLDPSAVTKRVSSPAKRVQGVSTSSTVSVIGIGGNGGAADALGDVLASLPTDTPPVVVTVSTIAGFVPTWIQKNQRNCAVKLQLASPGELLKPGYVYIASSDFHVKIVRDGSLMRLETIKAAPVSGQRPSADILFESLATHGGADGVAVMLSGYGQDGVLGLLRVREVGGWTICQDPKDSTFNFNVAQAIEQGAACEVAPRESIGEKIYARRSASVLGRAG